MLVNGSAAEHVSVEDRGLLYGDGLFETILCERGQPVLFAEHMQRLQSGCEKLNICKPSIENIQSELAQVAQQSDCIVKVIITRGVRARGYQYDPSDASSTRIVYRSELPNIPSHNYTSGIKLCLCKTKLPDNAKLAGVKHLNRLDQVIARSEWGRKFEEGIMLDSRENVVEGTMSNIFVEKGSKWLTPILDFNGVEGVMREFILKNANKLDMECVQSHIDLQQMQQSKAMFVCNSVIGVWPVASFNSNQYTISAPTRRLMQFLHNNISSLYKVA